MSDLRPDRRSARQGEYSDDATATESQPSLFALEDIMRATTRTSSRERKAFDASDVSTRGQLRLVTKLYALHAVRLDKAYEEFRLASQAYLARLKRGIKTKDDQVELAQLEAVRDAVRLELAELRRTQNVQAVTCAGLTKVAKTAHDADLDAFMDKLEISGTETLRAGLTGAASTTLQ